MSKFILKFVTYSHIVIVGLRNIYFFIPKTQHTLGLIRDMDININFYGRRLWNTFLY